MATYPGAVWPDPSFNDADMSAEMDHVQWRDEISAEVRAIELELGTTPSGSDADVKERVENLEDEKADLAGADFTGSVTINRASTGTPLILKQGSESPSLRFQSQAGTEMAAIIVTASSLAINTLNDNTINLSSPANIINEGGVSDRALTLRAATETPELGLTSVAGTTLLRVKGSATTSSVEAFDDLNIVAGGSNAITIDGSTQLVTIVTDATIGDDLTVTDALIVGGALDHNGSTVGFYGVAPTARSTGWGAPTGTATKTTFATTTVTTQQLAERVKAIIDYLMLRGDFGT